MISDPVLVGANFCINYRQFTATTGNAPTHNPHLDPGVIKFTDQGTPRISLEEKKKKETRMYGDHHQKRLISSKALGILLVSPRSFPRYLAGPGFLE